MKTLCEGTCRVHLFAPLPLRETTCQHPEPARFLKLTSMMFLVMATMLAPVNSFADPIIPYIVAQSDYNGQNGNTGGATYGYPAAQTFTPSSGGMLFSISAGFYAPQSVLDPYYLFQFRDTTPAGLPSSLVIATVNVPTDILHVTPPGGSGWVDLTADFSSYGIALSAGHTYALSVDVPGPFGQSEYNTFIWGATGSGYAGGKAYVFTPGGPVEWAGEDFLFKVTAVPVPEPSLYPLAAILCAGALRTRSRHRA